MRNDDDALTAHDRGPGFYSDLVDRGSAAMTDLVKRLRKGVEYEYGEWIISVAEKAMDEAADEIERLQNELEDVWHLAKHHRKFVIEDMRAWAHENQEKLKGDGPQRIIYAYAKDRGIE